MIVARRLLLIWLVLLTGCSIDDTFGEETNELGGTLVAASGPVTTAVDIDSGRLQGAEADAATGVRVFRGIPYAAPPVGDLRFRAPVRPARWSGVRSALDFGTACWQDFSHDSFVWSRGDFQRSEDCLYLNVWSGAQERAEKRPVMVWFHGGSHTVGYGHSKIFDGTELARQGVVLVSINYRLGPLGFLAHEALEEDGAAGNYGLMDKIEALKWVRRNILSFGGDPDNVTIFGQSAGSSSVCYLMTSPQARGLFHKAIGQSAACLLERTGDPDLNGYKRGAALVGAAGLKANVTAEALRQLDPQALLAAANSSGWQNGSRITIDGRVVPQPPLEAFQAGTHNRVPLLVGSMSDEGNQLLPLNTALTKAMLNDRLVKRFGVDAANELQKLYAKDLAESAGLAQREILIDQFMAWSMRTWARQNSNAGQPSYLYFFPHIPPAFRLYLPHATDLQLPDGPRSGGAYHSGDLAYVFGTVDLVGMDWTERDRQLSREITGYWTNFAKSGNPNGSGLPAWQQHSGNEAATMVFAENSATQDGVRTTKLDLFDQLALARRDP